jgi:hypothetical protein
MPSGEESDKDSPGSVFSWLIKGIDEIWAPETYTFGYRETTALHALSEIYLEYSQENWDGYGAAPISPGAYEEAKKLLRLLPPYIRMPDILVEPAGDIAFEWWKSSGQVFVLSVRGKHKISYAGISGGDKSYGTVYFGETFPLVIYEHLRRLLS